MGEAKAIIAKLLQRSYCKVTSFFFLIFNSSPLVSRENLNNLVSLRWLLTYTDNKFNNNFFRFVPGILPSVIAPTTQAQLALSNISRYIQKKNTFYCIIIAQYLFIAIAKWYRVIAKWIHCKRKPLERDTSFFLIFNFTLIVSCENHEF